MYVLSFCVPVQHPLVGGMTSLQPHELVRVPAYHLLLGRNEEWCLLPSLVHVSLISLVRVGEVPPSPSSLLIL